MQNRSLFAITAFTLFRVFVLQGEEIQPTDKRWHLTINDRTFAKVEKVTDKNGVAHDAIHFTVDYSNLTDPDGYKPGAVYLRDLPFRNGTIEADIAGPLMAIPRTYVGIAFRLDPKKPSEHELIYFRPFNAGTPNRQHTVQYVATDTIYDWPYLRRNFPGVYEASAGIADNIWFHVRLEIDGTVAKVFVNQGQEPVFVVKDLKLGERTGLVGFWGYPGAFANLKITPRGK